MSLFKEELDSSLSLSLSLQSLSVTVCVGVSERVNERLVITRGTVRTVQSNVSSKKKKYTPTLLTMVSLFIYWF